MEKFDKSKPARYGVLLLVLVSVVVTACLDNKAPSDKIKVISTIKPVHAIVYAIAGDQVDAQQLIPDYASPHDYTVKPSDIKKVKQADIIFRIDENMEIMLNPVIAQRSPQSQLISLADTQNITLLPFSGGETQEKESTAGEGHDHHHGNLDYHIWTSPENALTIAQVIKQTLQKLDIDKQAIYAQNLALFNQELKTTTDKIKKELAHVKLKPYLVMHNSWQYFAHYFGLKEPEVLSLQSGIAGNVNDIRAARAKIVSEGIVCVFSEPGVNPNKVKTLIEGLNVKTTEIDVLLSGMAVNKETYIKWLSSMSSKIRTCLE